MKTKSETPSPLIVFENVTLRIRDRHILPETDWCIRSGENWMVTGPNGAGKSTLMGAIVGNVPVVCGRIRRYSENGRPGRLGYVSFEQQRHIIAMEASRDAGRSFSGRIDDMTTAGQIISGHGQGFTDPAAVEKAVAVMDVGHLLCRDIRKLSTGEFRRTMIARALATDPVLLILDEPFDGLDRESRQRVKAAILRLIKKGIQVVWVSHRPEEVPETFTRWIRVENDRVRVMPERRIAGAGAEAGRLMEAPLPTARVWRWKHERFTGPELVSIRNATVQYGDVVVFKGLDWTLKQGENWAVTGPNGAGKTTLLQLISGDCPQAYANDIYLFGRLRGSGESIWDIRHRIGMVGCETQIHYRKSIRADEVVLSGFYDSVGLYRRPKPEEKAAAAEWLSALGMADRANRHFDRLSSGEQRMILIARAMIKMPDLLILDEPYQGLDPINRDWVARFVEKIGEETDTHLLMVTHYEEEIPNCIRRVMTLPAKRCREIH